MIPGVGLQRNQEGHQNRLVKVRGIRDSARINHPVLLVFSVIFFVTERVS
jgi:hypothetical protein